MTDIQQDPLHEKKKEYVMRNIMPLVSTVFENLHKKGVINESHDHGDLYEHGVAGVMKAMHKYDPAKNPNFAAYALPSIEGSIRNAIGEHEKKHVLQYDKAKAKMANAATGGAAGQMVGSTGGMTARTQAENIGSGGGDGEEGGAGFSVGREISPSAKFAQKAGSNFVNNYIGNKVKSYEDKQKQAASQPIMEHDAPDHLDAPEMPAAAPVEPVKPKIEIRRRLNPEQQARMDSLNASKGIK